MAREVGEAGAGITIDCERLEFVQRAAAEWLHSVACIELLELAEATGEPLPGRWVLRDGIWRQH